MIAISAVSLNTGNLIDDFRDKGPFIHRHFYWLQSFYSNCANQYLWDRQPDPGIAAERVAPLPAAKDAGRRKSRRKNSCEWSFEREGRSRTKRFSAIWKEACFIVETPRVCSDTPPCPGCPGTAVNCLTSHLMVIAGVTCMMIAPQSSAVTARERRRSIAQMDDAGRKICLSMILNWKFDEPRALRRTRFAYVVGVPVLRSCATAVTSCAGANGLVSRMLFGTPLEAHSSALSPVI